MSSTEAPLSAQQQAEEEGEEIEEEELEEIEEEELEEIEEPGTDAVPSNKEEEEEEEEEEEAATDTPAASKEGDGDWGSNPPPSRPPSFGGASPGKIFIGGLSKVTTHDTFIKHFGKYGDITDSVIMKDRRSGHPRGFGFITYADSSVVDKVILDNHVINGKQVEIKRTIPKGAIPGPKDFKTKKIFVGGIPTTVTEDEFNNFFAKFGEVKEHQIMRDHSTSRSRGFGFVSFGTEQAVDDLLTKGNKIDFAGVQVEIKKAEPKKPSTSALPPTKFTDPRPPFGGGFRDSFGAGDFGAGPYMPGGGFRRPGAYGGYGGNDFDTGYDGGYGSTGMGPYGGESSLGFSGRYGRGIGRGYDLGGYGGPSEGYGRIGSGAFGSGYDSGYGNGYEGAGHGLYGSRRGYGGSANERFHPYSR